MRHSHHLLAFLLTLSAMAPVRGALIRVGEDVPFAAIEHFSNDGYVRVPFEFENNDQGTQYSEFVAKVFKPLFEAVYAFGNNSSFGSLENMINGQSGTKTNVRFDLNSSPDYVREGWTLIFQSNGEVYVQEFFQGEGSQWQNSVDSSINHTVKGGISIYAGLLSTTGNSGEYVFGDMTTGLQLAMSDNTYFEDFGVAAGVATLTTESTRITLPDDSRYVIAVIPEPGTLLLVGLAALALRFT